MNFEDIDILGRKSDTRCDDCNNPFGTYFAMNGGVCTAALCFSCIIAYIDYLDELIA